MTWDAPLLSSPLLSSPQAGLCVVLRGGHPPPLGEVRSQEANNMLNNTKQQAQQTNLSKWCQAHTAVFPCGLVCPIHHALLTENVAILNYPLH